jgi:hypothetical protein
VLWEYGVGSGITSYQGGEFSLDFGSVELSATRPNITIVNDFMYCCYLDQFGVSALADGIPYIPPTGFGLVTSGSLFPAMHASLHFTDPTGTAFSNKNLPAIPPSLEAFPVYDRTLSVTFTRDLAHPNLGNYFVSANVEYLGTTPPIAVHEPGAFGLLGTGLALLMLVRRRFTNRF